MPADVDIVLRRFLAALKEEQSKHAFNSLSRPPNKTEFGFGHVCGIHAGLIRAEQLFEEVIGEEEDRT
jgi:limonene-1,2-epoxide hydrolase